MVRVSTKSPLSLPFLNTSSILSPPTLRVIISELPLRRIGDARASIDLVGEKHLAEADELNELEHYAGALETELEEETRKWHSRWPDPEECCMILKLELTRAQAELDATYEQIQKRFAGMEAPKDDSTLIDIPFLSLRWDVPKIKAKITNSAAKITGDLISFEHYFPKETQISKSIIEHENTIQTVDFLTDYLGKDTTTSSIAMATVKLDILVDLSPDTPAANPDTNEIVKRTSIFDDLTVLVTDFPLPRENGREVEEQTERRPFRDAADIVQILSKGYSQLIKKRFESSNMELKDMAAEAVEVRNAVRQMQPLYDIGLAIRKRQVEIDSGKAKEDKDEMIIAKGNSAAHHGQVLADATWMGLSPAEQRFKEMYNGVSAETVLKKRDNTTFLEILNWNFNMRRFRPTGGVNRKVFDKFFNAVFSRLFPSLRLADSDFERDGNLRIALAGMRSEHSAAYEREVQTRKMNRLILKSKQVRAQRTSGR